MYLDVQMIQSSIIGIPPTNRKFVPISKSKFPQTGWSWTYPHILPQNKTNSSDVPLSSSDIVVCNQTYQGDDVGSDSLPNSVKWRLKVNGWDS